MHSYINCTSNARVFQQCTIQHSDVHKVSVLGSMSATVANQRTAAVISPISYLSENIMRAQR